MSGPQNYAFLNVTCSGAMSVAGVATAANVVASRVTANSAILGNTTAANLSCTGLTATSAQISGALTVSGGCGLGEATADSFTVGQLIVDSFAGIGADMNVGGNLAIIGALTSSGTTVNGDLVVTGLSTLPVVTSQEITCNVITANSFTTPNVSSLSHALHGVTTIMADGVWPTAPAGTDICGLQCYRNHEGILANASYGELDFVNQARLGSKGGYAFYTANTTSLPVKLAAIDSNGITSQANVTCTNLNLSGSILTGGVTLSSAELGYLDGTTQNIQTHFANTDANVAALQTLTASPAACRYDSGWFAVAQNNGYQKTHNLNITLGTPPLVRLLFSDVSAPVLGTNHVTDMTGCDGISVGFVNANTVAILIYNGFNFFAQTGTGTYQVTTPSSGYLRMLLY